MKISMTNVIKLTEAVRELDSLQQKASEKWIKFLDFDSVKKLSYLMGNLEDAKSWLQRKIYDIEKTLSEDENNFAKKEDWTLSDELSQDAQKLWTVMIGEWINWQSVEVWSLNDFSLKSYNPWYIKPSLFLLFSKVLDRNDRLQEVS